MKDTQAPLTMLLPTEQNWPKQGAYCTSPGEMKLAVSLPPSCWKLRNNVMNLHDLQDLYV